MYNRRWHGIKREKLAKKLHTHTYTRSLTHTEKHTQTQYSRNDVTERTGARKKLIKANYIYT